MFEWKCSNCGYMHQEAEAPNSCPVCGADQASFTHEGASAVKRESSVKDEAEFTSPSPEGVQRRWQCRVCGYIHTGPEPPEKCPVCGADRNMFVLLEETPAQTPDPQPPPPQPVEPPIPLKATARYYKLIIEKMVDLHAHPISVHIPNGVAPVAVLFALLGGLLGSPSLERAAVANMVIVLLAMPFVLFSGYNDWQQRFGGHMTKVFQGKMLCGGLFTLLSLWIVLWRFLAPGIIVPGSSGRWFYILLHLALVAVGAIAGYLGGKLVFGNIPRQHK